MEDEDIEQGEEPQEERPRMRLPPPPLLDSMPSRTCRDLLKRIRGGGISRDTLVREIHGRAARGELARGEARCLRAEIDRLFGDRPVLPKAAERQEGELFVEGMADGCAGSQKPRVFRPYAIRAKREPSRMPAARPDDALSKRQGDRAVSVMHVPVVGNAGPLFGTRIEIRGRTKG